MFEFEKDYTFPFKLHQYQRDLVKSIISTLTDSSGKGVEGQLLRMPTGTGKTAVATAAALELSYKDDVTSILVLCPPILIVQWVEWLESVIGKDLVCQYTGNPAKRKSLNLEDSPCVVMSFNIFRNDWKRIEKWGKREKLCVVADELSLKSLKGKTYRLLKQLLYRKIRIREGDVPYHRFLILNATPISDLGQIYNYTVPLYPGAYKSKRVFDSLHVAREDHWGNVLEWKNVDILNRVFDDISQTVDPEVVDLPPLTLIPLKYDLSKEHLKMYKNASRAVFEELPDELTDLLIQSTFSTLQSLVLVPEEYDPSVKSNIVDIIESFVDQNADEGFMIYTRHVSVSRKFSSLVPDSVSVYGEIPSHQKEEAIRKIKSGECKRLVGNLSSLSRGLNLQMLTRVLFVELPFRSDEMQQALARVHRQGQTKKCFATFPIARGTIQERIYENLLDNTVDIYRVMKDKTEFVKLALTTKVNKTLGGTKG